METSYFLPNRPGQRDDIQFVRGMYECQPCLSESGQIHPYYEAQPVVFVPSPHWIGGN